MTFGKTNNIISFVMWNMFVLLSFCYIQFLIHWKQNIKLKKLIGNSKKWKWYLQWHFTNLPVGYTNIVSPGMNIEELIHYWLGKGARLHVIDTATFMLSIITRGEIWVILKPTRELLLVFHEHFEKIQNQCFSMI